MRRTRPGAAVGALLKDERGEVADQSLALIPAAGLTVQDTWHAASTPLSFTIHGRHSDSVGFQTQIAEAGPLQHIRRDADTAPRHAGLVPAVGVEVYGKALLDVDDRPPCRPTTP
ncbi:hypothetical protein AB0C27_28590 [Nonomuraea sp. NPDC048882]|uniref:hypothetical protein n=1 Tax=unclassified Nonomuraea TaxID=2593643 RepID=UPI0034063A13